MRVNKVITLPVDLQGRAASEIMRQVSIEILQPIFLSKDNREVNLNSLLGVLSLGAKQGDRVTLSAYSEEALDECIKIINEEATKYGISN